MSGQKVGSDLVLDDHQLYEEFLNAKSHFTQLSYRKNISYLTGGDPAAFLTLARNNRWQATHLLINWVLEVRDRLRAGTVRSRLGSVKSMCDYAEISLPWKKIIATSYKPIKISNKKPAAFDAVQKMYEQANLQLKWILRIFMSGARVGAFQDLIVSDLQEIEVKSGTMDGAIVKHAKNQEELRTLPNGVITAFSERIPTPEEKDVFSILGLPWIEPKDRSLRGSERLEEAVERWT